MAAEEALEEVERAGETPVVLGAEGRGPVAVFGLANAVRRDARKTVEALRAAGIGEIVMLTGTRRRRRAGWRRPLAWTTGRSCSRSRRSKRCAGWSRSTAQRGW